MLWSFYSRWCSCLIFWLLRTIYFPLNRKHRLLIPDTWLKEKAVKVFWSQRFWYFVQWEKTKTKPFPAVLSPYGAQWPQRERHELVTGLRSTRPAVSGCGGARVGQTGARVCPGTATASCGCENPSPGPREFVPELWITLHLSYRSRKISLALWPSGWPTPRSCSTSSSRTKTWAASRWTHRTSSRTSSRWPSSECRRKTTRVYSITVRFLKKQKKLAIWYQMHFRTGVRISRTSPPLSLLLICIKSLHHWPLPLWCPPW